MVPAVVPVHDISQKKILEPVSPSTAALPLRRLLPYLALPLPAFPIGRVLLELLVLRTVGGQGF
jgi:hypothetical protein